MMIKEDAARVSVHRTVLLHEVIDGLLAPKKAGNKNLVVVDATFGGGGHSLEICKKYPSVKIIALDQDKSALDRGKEKFSDCKISFHNVNFRDLDKVLDEEVDPVRSRPLDYESATVTLGRPASNGIDGIIFDLGLSSDQLEVSGRGFSFLKDEPLLMTMKRNPDPEDVTAYDVVNTWGEENLADIIYGYGEEKFAKRIARGIVEARKKSEIKTTFDLVKIISDAVPAIYRRGRLHFATRTFQAIRIAVNDELGALAMGLEKGFKFLKSGGRIAVISFHSLEDRVVKKFFKNKEEAGEGKRVNKKIIIPSESEIKDNPRARSAKLRIIEKT